MKSQQWVPYRWEPVHWPGVDFRQTYAIDGTGVEDMLAVIGGRAWTFTVDNDGAELIIPDDELAAVPDRSVAEVRIKTGGMWHVLCAGYLTRRLT